MTVLKNAVVLITGAASGIGRLMALEAGSRGGAWPFWIGMRQASKR